MGLLLSTYMNPTTFSVLGVNDELRPLAAPRGVGDVNDGGGGGGWQLSGDPFRLQQLQHGRGRWPPESGTGMTQTLLITKQQGKHVLGYLGFLNLVGINLCESSLLSYLIPSN